MNANGGTGSSEQRICRAWRDKNRQNGGDEKDLIHLEIAFVRSLHIRSDCMFNARSAICHAYWECFPTKPLNVPSRSSKDLIPLSTELRRSKTSF
jgi:hypothetical protein